VRMLFPLADSGTVQDLIDQRPQGLSTPEAAAIFHGACAGIHFMHSHSPAYVHRDIKPANILLFGSTSVLTDFGSASEGAITVPSRKEVGRMGWIGCAYAMCTCACACAWALCVYTVSGGM
jgi:serine/threonine protein kinase